MSTRVDLTIESGATWEREFTVVDESGAPADLSGCTAKMDIKENLADAEPLLTLSTTDDTLTILAESGVIVARIEADDTAALTWASGVYDVLLSDGANRWRIADGNVTVAPGVTEL